MTVGASSEIRKTIRSNATGIVAVCIALGGTTLAWPGTVAAGGKPVVEPEVVEESFFDEFILDTCGIETNTTLKQRTTTKTWPDGSRTVHVNADFVPDDPTIASERNAFTDVIATDGTVTTKGLAIRLYRHGDETVIRDAGWVRFLEDGLVVRGPHPFLETNPADVYC